MVQDSFTISGRDKCVLSNIHVKLSYTKCASHTYIWLSLTTHVTKFGYGCDKCVFYNWINKSHHISFDSMVRHNVRHVA